MTEKTQYVRKKCPVCLVTKTMQYSFTMCVKCQGEEAVNLKVKALCLHGLSKAGYQAWEAA